MFESFILHKIAEWQEWAYLLIFLSMFVEGAIVLLAAVFAVEAGYLHWSYVLMAAFFGMALGDIAWYWLGPSIEKRFIPKRIVDNLLPILDRQIIKKPTFTIYIAKFIYFLHRVILVRLRPAGLNFKNFIKADLVAVVAWIITCVLIGVTFSVPFLILRKYLVYAEIGLLVVFVIFIIAGHYGRQYLEKKLWGNGNDR